MRLFTYQALMLFALLATQLQAEAEILKTGADVYQSTNQRLKVIVSREEPGIFIANVDPIDIQTFHPGQIKKDHSLAVFVGYDQSKRVYSKLLVGKQEYRITGNFTIKIGGLRIAVDNRNPYLSIIMDKLSEQGQISVLGFMGLQEIVKHTGGDSASLLEANTFADYDDLIEPYELKADGLHLKGKSVESRTIGLTIEYPRNPCLGRKSRSPVYITELQVAELKAITTRQQRLDMLSSILTNKPSNSPLEQLLILKVDRSSVIGLDYRKSEIKVVRPLSSEKRRQTLCVIESVYLD